MPYQELLAQFGFNQFRPGQQQVVTHLMDGQSAAAIFPTGSGKSLCYQLPALALPNLTLVVSPLLALMQDQLSFLQQKGIAAATIDSSQTPQQVSQTMQSVRNNQIKILMVSVERFNNERFRQFLTEIHISLLVVDEAHCISEWGHNFRPDYLKLPQYQQDFNIKQVLLLTATATSQVIDDMAAKFAIPVENISTTGFYRPNLNIEAVGVVAEQRINYLKQWLSSKNNSSGIVYVTLQQTAEEVATALQQAGFSAQAYHAGMNNEIRQQLQQDFMQNKVRIMVATIAFGMGIDKADIRFVTHYDLAKSLENYAQEIGRAGRDGNPSDCLLMLNSDKLNVLENFIYGDTPQQSEINHVLDEIKQHQTVPKSEWPIKLHTLANESNIRLLTLKTLLVYLELNQIIKPKYSYFAEYKLKFLTKEKTILESFEGERRTFLEAVFNSCKHSRVWSRLDLEALQQTYPADRSRVISALDYLAEKQQLEVAAGQITDVYQVTQNNIATEQLTQTLFSQFHQKEESEIKRLQDMLSLFTSNQCLTKQLCQYFSDSQLAGKDCGHCSVCSGNVAQLPETKPLAPLDSYNFAQLAGAAIAKLGSTATPVLVSRFLAGLTTPIFTRLKMRSLVGFSQLENYRYSNIRSWVEKHWAN